MLLESKIGPKLLADIGLFGPFRAIFTQISNMAYARKYERMVRNGYRLPMPEIFVMEPTARCNLNCKMCYFKDHKPMENEITLEEFKRIIDGIPTIKYINFTGGEVFSRTDFLDMLDYLKEKGIKAHLTTNGTLIDERAAERLNRNGNIVAIVVSIDGRKEIHNSIRGWDQAFDRTMKGVELVKGKHLVAVVCVIQNDNLANLSGVVRLVKGMGIKSVIFEYERRYTERDVKEVERVLDAKRQHLPLTISKTERPNFSFDELKSKLDLAEKTAKETGIRIHYLPRDFRKELMAHYYRISRMRGRYFCRLLFKPRIDAQGNVIHCYAVRKPMGNLLDKPFEEIWNSEEYIRFRKDMTRNNLLPVCENCLHMQRMGGGS